MSVEDGGYILINCAKLNGTPYAMDTKGAVSSNGSNVRLYAPNASDAQLVTVQTYGDYQVIRFPLTGMVLDVQGGRVAQGQNVQQYTWNKGKGQQWQIDATSSSYTYQGTSYTAHKIKSAIDTGYEIEAYGAASAVTNGTNLDIATTSSDKDHLWLFVPAPILQEGRAYKLLSASDHSVVAGLSGNSGDVQVKLLGETDSNDQRWLMVNSFPTVKVSPLSNSKLFMAPKGYTAAASTVVNVLKDSTDQSTRWYPTIVGSQTLNGQQFPLVTLRNMEGVNIVLDVKGASSSVGANLQVYGSNGGKNQQFLAVPETALDAALPAASKLGVADSVGGKAETSLAGSGSTSAHLSWLGTAYDWELRYRLSYRDASKGQSDWDGWTAWKGLQGNATAGRGWGTGENATCIPEKQRDPVGAMRNYARALSLYLSGNGKDAVRIQWEVRQWAGRSSAFPVNRHGNVATATSRIYFMPTCTISAARWSTDGLSLEYASDQLRGGNKLTVTRLATVIGGAAHVFYEGEGIQLEGLAGSGSVTIPQEALNFLFDEGDAISVSATWTNADGASVECSFDGTVAYGSGKSSFIVAPTVVQPSESNGWMLSVDASQTSADVAGLYLDYGNRRLDFVRFEDDGDMVWNVPVRYGEAFTVCLIAEDGAEWDKFTVGAFPAVDNPARYVFNYEGGCFVIHGNVGAPPTFQLTQESNVDAQMTTGTRYEVVHYGFGRKVSGSVAGVYAPAAGTMHAEADQLEALADAGYSWLRDEVNCYRVAVTGYTLGKTPAKWDEVSVDFRLIDPPGTY